MPAGTYVGDDGLSNYEPCAQMFLAAAIVALLVLIPYIILAKRELTKTRILKNKS